MTSPEADALRSHLRSVKAQPPAASIEEFRARIEALAAPFATLPDGCRTQPGNVGGVAGEWVHAAGEDPARAVLYLHGGTYVGGSSASHRGLAARLAKAAAAPVFTADYRRAPEHPFPAAVEDAQAAFDALAAQLRPGHVVAAGDSAGSALATAVALHRKANRQAGPAGLVLLSPWSDLACTGASFTALEEQDPWMSGARLRRSAGLYLGGADATDRRASPLHADWTGLPPTLIHVGSDEVLLDDATRLAERARAAGVRVDLHVAQGMWHVWHLFAARLPEGRRAIADAGAWIRRLPGWG